jgi:hypothetical protein
LAAEGESAVRILDLVASFAEPSPNCRQPFGKLRLKPALDRSIVISLHAQIVLRGDALGRIVRIFITFAVTQTLCACIVPIS